MVENSTTILLWYKITFRLCCVGTYEKLIPCLDLSPQDITYANVLKSERKKKNLISKTLRLVRILDKRYSTYSNSNISATSWVQGQALVGKCLAMSIPILKPWSLMIRNRRALRVYLDQGLQGGWVSSHLGTLQKLLNWRVGRRRKAG